MLGTSDLPALIDGIAELAGASSEAELELLTARRAVDLVPCRRASVKTLALPDGAITTTSWPPESTNGCAAFARFVHEQPAISAHRRGGDGPLAVSDFFTEERWRRSALFRRVLDPAGVVDQLSVALWRSAEIFALLVVERSGWGFGEGERAAVASFGRSFARIRGEVAKRAVDERVIEAAIGAIESLRAGLIALDHEDRPDYWSPTARRLASAAFGEVNGAPPARLAAWLAGDREAGANGAGEQVLCEGPVRFSRIDRAVLVREDPRTAAEELLGLGLTERQADVLALLAEGLTDEEIAGRLSLSPRTVQKHVQHIFGTLGVHTRTAAAAKALEARNDV